MNNSKSARLALFWFSFKQLLKGAVIVGIIAGLQIFVQGVAYQKAYNTTAKRTAVTTSLANAPGLGFIYGDPQNLQYGTQGYMVYRVLAFLSVVAAAWALMVTTRLFRGAEEDGRYELIRTGIIPPRQATALLLAGFAGAWWVGLLISYVFSILALKAGNITGTDSAMWTLCLAIFLPGLLFGGAGTFTSQLGLTRGRALLYAIVPLAVLFLMRGVGNVDSGLHWLLYWTPFGWAQLVSPVYNTDHVWILSLAGSAIVLGALGIWFSQRDYGESIIKTSTTVRSRFYLLGSPWSLALRQTFWSLLGWGLGAIIMISMIAGITNTAVSTLKAAGGLSKAINKLGGGNSLKVAFMSAGVLFMVMILLVMSTSLLGQIRRDEAKQYLDNILVEPQKRTVWLAQRLLLGFGVVLTISIAAGLVLLAIASAQHITLDSAKVLATSVCVVGSVAFLMGIGALFYGFLPRFSGFIMYAVITWSFAITLIASAVSLNTVVKHSTLFLYTGFNLSNWPDWTTFFWFMLLAVAMSAAGIWGFARRDIISE